MKNKYQVKVIGGKYKGCTFEGALLYHDYLHTGSSPDLFNINTPKGIMTITSDLIDISHYEEQLLNNTIHKLGANIGDTVKITRAGSSYYKRDWIEEGPHVITAMTANGYITFDHGIAECFQPDVIVIQSAKHTKDTKLTRLIDKIKKIIASLHNTINIKLAELKIQEV